MKKWMETHVPRRVLSLALSAAMVLSLLPVSAFAEGNDGLCAHHTEHTAECGYVTAVAGQDCTHVCGDDCFTLTTACTHVHGAECYGDGVLPAEGEEKTADACTHQCTEESGCVTKTPACVHTAHDEACGYAPAVEGQSCGFVCGFCTAEGFEEDTCPHGGDPASCETCASDAKVASVQTLIDALPEDVTAETKETAQSALSAVDTAKSSLTAEEQALLDMTRYTALTGKLAALEAPAPDTTEETTEKTDKVITGWAWVDPDKWLDETGSFAMPGVTEDSPAYFDDVVEYLPTQITADGGEVLTLGDWVCDTYPMETGTSQGAYVFETTLPEGYILSDGSNVLRVNVTIAPVDLTEGPEAAVYATDIPYLDSAGLTQICPSATEVTDSDAAWSNGWYVVQASDTPLTINSRVTVSGEVHLILEDGCNLTVSGGISVNESNSLTIYAQSTGSDMGKLTAQNVNNLYAGIGGDENFSGGTIIINGGTVTAKGGEQAAGIGGGQNGSGGTITINGGNVTATGNFGVGIGGGYDGTGGNITISGGNVTATGGTTAAGIGGSNSDSGGEITISGNAIVNATGGMLAAGIGGGSVSAGGIITISGGTVTANGGQDGGAGIGGGDRGSGGTITISGGTVTATGNSYGAGIGGGGSNWTNGGDGGNITISGGNVTATGGKNGGAGIGGGQGASTSGGSGTFSTGTNGSAVIYASSISDTSSQGSWSGIIFEGDNGTVYGDQTLTEDLTIEAEKTLTVPAGAKLTIPEGVTLTSNGTITNNGTIIKNGTINGTITGNQPPVSVKYLDASGTETTCANATEVTGSNTAWSNGWYVAQGNVTIDSRVTVSGEVHLILADGCNLTASGGIGVNENNSLTIYAQSTGENMGKLIATSSDGAGIGGDSNSNGNGHNGGTITINGGKVTATGGEWAAGIGGGAGSFGDGGSGGNITINGGTVTATSSDGAGIGGGMSNYTGGSGGNITINGGTVTATGSSYGAGIGGGFGEDGGSGGTITINGGTVTATGSQRSAGIGGGHGLTGGAGGTIIIRGGTVTATGGSAGGAGIGGGKGASTSGDSGTFSTGENGNAVIFASSISDKSQNDSWGGSVYFPLNLTDCTASGDVSDYPGKTYAKAGSSITLTPDEAPEGKAFTRWQLDDETILRNGNSFKMPTNAVTVKAVFGDIVASVTHGGTVTNYASLSEAFAAASGAEGSTLKLHADVTTDSNLSVGYSFTLDLNGKTLTSTIIGYEAISVTGSLTITDSSATKNGVIQTNTNQYVICNYGNLTIEGGAIHAQNCIYNSNNGRLDMRDGTLETNSSGTGFCICNEVGSVVTITGGTLKKQAGSNIFKRVGRITLQGGSFPDGISVLEDGSVRSLLGEGYAFYDLDAYTNQNEKWTLVSVGNILSSIGTGVVVLEHLEHTFSYEKNDDYQHIAACECGYSETVNHDFKDNNGFCKQCDAYEPAEKVSSAFENKYNIYNAGQLFWFADYVNKNAESEARSARGSLQKDIRIPVKADGSKRQWTPIGTDDKSYLGEFYGNGYTVSGLYITNQEDYSSFFGVVRGSIRDLTIADSTIDAPSTPNGYAAGICGILKAGEIRNCTNRVDISCGDMQSAAGICVDNNGTISGCTNTGTIRAGSFATAGGICATNGKTIEYCTNSGQIQSGGNAGGICAQQMNGEIKNCANSGRVNGDGNVAGICGNNQSIVSSCYNIGDVITPIIKNNFYGQARNCYYLANEEIGGIGGTTFKTRAQFASGEVAYLLNMNPSTDETVWGQRIGEELYPVLGGDRVYYHNSSCPIYSNSEEESNKQHTLGENGTCEHCGVALEATVTITDDGSGQTYGYVNLEDAFAAANGKTATITLLKDVNIGSNTLTISGGEVTFQSAEKSDPAAEGPTSYTITANEEHSSNAVTGIAVTGGTFNFDSGILQVSSGLDGIRVTGGTLNFRDGTIKHYNGMSIRIMEGEANISGGTIQGVCADGGTLNISDGSIELLIVTNAQTALSGGSFKSIYNANAEGKVSDLLADGYAYYLVGRWVDATNGSNTQNLDSSTEAIQVRSVPVKINTQPLDITMTYGEDKSLSVSTFATEIEVLCQWYQVTTGEGEVPMEHPVGMVDSFNFNLSDLNAGSYQFFCRLTCDGYILNSNTVTVTVNKAIVETPTIDSKSYNGSVQTAEVPESTLYTVTTNDGGTNAGSYDVVLKLVDPENYKWDDSENAEKTIQFKITQAGNSWTTEPAISGWTYGEAAKAPTYKAEFGTVKVEYTSDSITYSEAVPTNAGSYKARFTVEGTDNYGGLSEVKDFTISPKAITATITPNGGTYGNVTPATAVLNGVLSGDTVPVTLTYTGTANDGTTHDSTTAPSNAGSYTVTASIGDSNYNLTGTTTATFVIQKLTVKTPDNVSTTYNGENQTTGIVETDYYNADTTSRKDADTYDVQLVLKDSNNCQWDERSGKLTFTIEKATNGWIDNPRSSNWTYGDNPNIDGGKPKAGTTKIEYSTDGGETYSETVPTDAGKYKIRFTVTDKNYQDLVAVRDITIDKRYLTITWGSTTSFPYDGENHHPTAEALNVVPGDSITLVVSGAQKNVGNCTATVTGFTAAAGTKVENYSLPSTNLSSQFSIQAKALTVNVRVKDKQYDGLNTATIDGTPTLDGVIEADQGKVTLNNGTPTFKSEDVGNDIEIVFTTGFYISGTASGNYTLTQPTGITASIYNNYTAQEGTDYTSNSSQGWMNEYLKITAASGYQLSVSNLAIDSWNPSITVQSEGVYTLTFYVRNTATGAISQQVTVGYKVDKTAPTGTISFDGSDATSSTPAALYKNKDVAVTLEGSDALSGVGSVSYFVSGVEKSDEELKVITGWTEGKTFTVTSEDGATKYVYAKVVDNAGNVTYVRANYILFDTTAPSVTGVEDGKTYCTTQTVTVADANLESLTLNGTAATSPITLEGNREATHTIVATDKAGNVTTVTVTMNTLASLTEEVENVGDSNVTKGDKENLEAAKEALEQQLTSATEEEKQEISKLLKPINEALAVLETVEKTERQIQELPIPADIKTDDEDETTENAIKAARADYNALSDHEKTLVDAENLQKLVDLEKALVDYKIVSGDGRVWNIGSGADLSFTANGPIRKLKQVDLDDKALDSSNYQVTKGSTIVTLNAAFVQSLEEGSYTLRIVYTDGQTEEAKFEVKRSKNYLNLENNTDFAGHTEVWVDGVAYPIQTTDGRHVLLPDAGDLLTVYTYKQGNSNAAHENYPTGMEIYRITRTEDGATVEKIDELDNLLQYSGCSIRTTGKRGIRMITSMTKRNKAALTGSGLAGYTLVEYGTVVQWADTLGSSCLTLDTGKHNYAYKKGVSDPVFANAGDLTQYTNVLIWNSLTKEQLGQDIVMRPYIILRDGSGNTVTLYGGCVSRSIGYIAYQNRTVFNPGTAAYAYVWDIIHAVYGNQYDSDYKG